MASTNEKCPYSGCEDVVSRALCKIGIRRSMLITLALVPFAWDGVVWCATAVESLWSLATNAVAG